MKYKCFCHKENHWDLTKDEIKAMIRGKKNFTPEEFINYYHISPETYREFIMAKGFVCTHKEREYLNRVRGQLDKKKNADVQMNELTFDWKNVDEIPKGLICAIYNIDFEEIDKKRYYDVEQLRRAKEDLQNKLDTYYHRVNTKEEEFSKLKHYDLTAMRMFRDYSKRELSKMADLPFESINMYEKKGSRVPKVVANAYIDALKIKKRHLIQLREIMSGKAENVIDDREIPKFIKLKVWSRDKGKCADCGSGGKVHYHHIKHFADGGRHTEDNIKLLCVPCHAEEHKGEKPYYLLKKMAEE